MGPILYEYYSGTELVGRTSQAPRNGWRIPARWAGPSSGGCISSARTASGNCRRGSRASSISRAAAPEYHKDPAKTRKAYNARGWATYGDIGYLDADGYLYLTDRLSNMIVSGGVNIYPQEAENLLCTHPAVADVAVIGVPDAEFGEAVGWCMRDPSDAGPALAQALIDYCRARLSPIKCPKSVDFSTDLPRTETGKLLKRLVKQRYWPAGEGIAR